MISVPVWRNLSLIKCLFAPLLPQKQLCSSAGSKSNSASPFMCYTGPTKCIYAQSLTRLLKVLSKCTCPCLNLPVCVCTWCLFACWARLRLLFEDVIALLLFSTEWPGMDLCGLFSSQWPVQIVNRSPMNCGFSGFVSLQTRFCR